MFGKNVKFILGFICIALGIVVYFVSSTWIWLAIAFGALGLVFLVLAFITKKNLPMPVQQPQVPQETPVAPNTQEAQPVAENQAPTEEVAQPAAPAPESETVETAPAVEIGTEEAIPEVAPATEAQAPIEDNSPQNPGEPV